jgi:hypothetical protein
MCQVNDEVKDILDKKYDLLHKKLKALIDKKKTWEITKHM